MDKIRRAAYQEIDLGAIEKNFLAVKALAQSGLTVCSVKADAYGHGLVRTAKVLEESGAGCLAVATLDEAAALRDVRIATPIVMFSAPPRSCMDDILRLGIIPTITSLEDARLFSEAAGRMGAEQPADIVIAVDTGMGRLGFLCDEKATADIARIAALPHVRIAAVASHFATSEEADAAYTHRQADDFVRFCEKLSEAGIRPQIRSIANSAALARFPETHFEAVRPGIVLYGIYPSQEVNRSMLPVEPVMSVRANIVHIKKMPPGSFVSYGRRFHTERESLIATLPLGYADGLPRSLGNRGRVIVRGRYAQIVGTVCMDQCMIDVTGIEGVCEYDVATIMGSADGLSIGADEIAEKDGTISYEVLCRFGMRLPKVYI